MYQVEGQLVQHTDLLDQLLQERVATARSFLFLLPAEGVEILTPGLGRGRSLDPLLATRASVSTVLVEAVLAARACPEFFRDLSNVSMDISAAESNSRRRNGPAAHDSSRSFSTAVSECIWSVDQRANSENRSVGAPQDEEGQEEEPADDWIPPVT